MSPTYTDSPFLTIKQVAERLNLSDRTVKRLIAEEGLPVVRPGGSVRINPAEFDQWLYGGPGLLRDAGER